MERAVFEAIREMLTSHRVLGLAVLVDGDPEASLLPYALRPDLRAVYVQASGMARHSRGLLPGAVVGVLIHETESPDVDPMQLRRLTLQATVTVLDRGGELFDEARKAYVAAFPGAELTLGLGDFNLYELRFERGRYVAGFGQAYNLGRDTFESLAAP